MLSHFKKGHREMLLQTKECFTLSTITTKMNTKSTHLHIIQMITQEHLLTSFGLGGILGGGF